MLHLHVYVPGTASAAVPVNAMQPSDTDAQGSSVSDSVSSISESSEKGSGSGPTLERRGLGLGTRARARMHVPGEKGWYLIPAATNSASAASARLLCLFCNALSMLATDASRPPRRTRRRLRAPPRFGWCPHRSSPRKRLDFVARLRFLPVAHTELFQGVYFTNYAFFNVMLLRPNVLKSSGVYFVRCDTIQL